MPLTLGQAAAKTGKSKPTILKALKTGRLSGKKAGNEWQIEPAELFRVYPQTTTVNDNTLHLVNPSSPSLAETAILEVKVEMLTAQLEREKETVEDLRRRLDRAEDRLLALSPPSAPTVVPRSLWKRLLGL